MTSTLPPAVPPVTVPVPAESSSYNRATVEAAELAAFEKGRMAGEMEAMRRAEAEAPLKTFGAQEAGAGQIPVNAGVQADVVEINRLTWEQRAAAVLGEMTSLLCIAIVAWVLFDHRGGFGWTNDDQNGDGSAWNTGLLCGVLGLFFQANAITNYRMLPLNLNANLNRAWYIFMQSCAIVCWTILLAALIMTPPPAEQRFWHTASWCFLLAYALYTSHALYSMTRAMLEPVWPVSYELWAEIPDTVDLTAKSFRPHGKERGDIPTTGLAPVDPRTRYAAAPVSVYRGKNLPATNANVGAQVPAAPLNAPRWTETPRTFSEDYFLLARSKWANMALWGMAASLLMLLAMQQYLEGSTGTTWAQGGAAGAPMSLNSQERDGLGVLGFFVLLTTMLFSYVAVPPRTTLSKRGLAADVRRSSISQAPVQGSDTIV